MILTQKINRGLTCSELFCRIKLVVDMDITFFDLYKTPNKSNYTELV